MNTTTYMSDEENYTNRAKAILSDMQVVLFCAPTETGQRLLLIVEENATNTTVERKPVERWLLVNSDDADDMERELKSAYSKLMTRSCTSETMRPLTQNDTFDINVPPPFLEYKN